MLEMFFDNEKVFTVFKEILKSKSEEINMAELLWKSDIPVSDAAEILQSFVFLGILEETKDTEKEGIFRFNPTSKIVLAICVFDDIVGKYSIKKIDKMIENGEDKIFSFVDGKEDEETYDFSSMEDFEKFLKENGLL